MLLHFLKLRWSDLIWSTWRNVWIDIICNLSDFLMPCFLFFTIHYEHTPVCTDVFYGICLLDAQILSLWALALWLNPLEMHRSARLWALPPSSLVLSLFLITLSLCSLYPTVLFLRGKFLTWDGTATFLRSPLIEVWGLMKVKGWRLGWSWGTV